MLDWLVERAAEEPTLFGFDFSFAPPLIERGAYLPGEPGVPDEARPFWAYVDQHARDEDLGAAAVATAIAFGLGGRDFAARMLAQWQIDQMPPPPPVPPRLKKVTPGDDSQPPLV